MTFTPDIPQTGQSLGATRDPIRNNFTNYNTLVSVNHVAPNAVGQGKHKFVEMPVQSPDPATLAGEGGLFTKTTSSSSELFYLRDAVATTYQMTGPLFTGQGALTKGGTTMLFGGIVLKWGFVSVGAGTTSVSFNTQCGSNFPTNCFTVTTTSGSSTSSLASVNSVTNASFNVVTNAVNTVYFIAIGN